MTPLRLGARLAAVAIAVAACARAMPPPGGVPDQLAPQIVATSPEPLSVVEPFEGPVVFTFDERLSEQNIEGSVVVSPATGEVEVSKDGRELRVKLRGGWRPGVVYRVLLAPGIRDLFRNERRSPVDLVFSTGPPIQNTAFGGLVSDRITGRPEAQAIVEATRRADSLTYVAAVDSLGFFAFRNLPLGIYEVTAYTDRNRNRRHDTAEPLTRVQVVSLNSERDTVDLDLAVVPNDTTPPRLLRAEGRDSLQIALFTDDYIDTEAGMDGIEVDVLTLPDSEAVDIPFRLMLPDSFAARTRERADSIRQDSLRAAAAAGDTAAARILETPPPTITRPPVRQPPGGAEPLPSIGPPPVQQLVLAPQQPLSPGRYEVTIRNLLNISGRGGGGGTARFEIQPPRAPPPDTSGAARVDTAAVAVRGSRR